MTADLNGDGDTTDTGTAPDVSGYVDGDDYLVTGTLVGAAALTGAKQALDGFNTTNGITFTKGSYNYAELKGSANNLKGISSDLATVTNLLRMSRASRRFFPRPAALSDLQTLKTALKVVAHSPITASKATTKELADIRGSSFDWVTNATAQSGIKYHELTDYGLDATTNAALVQSLNPSDYVFTTSGFDGKLLTSAHAPAMGAVSSTEPTKPPMPPRPIP